MNILSSLFGIFRQQGLVTIIKDGSSLSRFTISAIIFSLLGGVLYGFAMGIGLGLETAIKDALKIGLIIFLSLLFSIPIFLVAYRLLGREEPPLQVVAVPLTFLTTVALILAVTAPIVFMLSILTGYNPAAVYIHVVVIDLALLVGLYLAGTLLYYGFAEHKRLIVPNVIGFLMITVILVVLIGFMGPFLVPSATFSVGTDRLQGGLGIGVAEKVEIALTAASTADHVSYRFQTTNDNGDLVRDYTVIRIGDDYLITVHTQAVSGELFRSDQQIWVLDGRYYTDFEDGRITETSADELTTLLNPALPPTAFTLSPEFSAASWRAFERDGLYTATGISSSATEATLVFEITSNRLSSLSTGSAERGLHRQISINDIAPVQMDRDDLEATLNQAIVVGDVDRSDASQQDYVQEDTFFVARYPRTWQAGSWSAAQQQVKFSNNCGNSDGCPTLTVSVFDLVEGKGPQQYAEELGHSLSLQPENRGIHVDTTTIGEQIVGIVEYLADRTVKGEIETTQHIEYIFAGEVSRYHLDFVAPQLQFETYRSLFTELARRFTYLQPSLDDSG